MIGRGSAASSSRSSAAAPRPAWSIRDRRPTGIPSASYAGGWEHAEARSKDAIRTNAVYLNDEAIAARALQRKLLREGIREALAEAKERQKKIEADRLAEAAARREAQRQWEAQRAERSARRANSKRLGTRKKDASQRIRREAERGTDPPL